MPNQTPTPHTVAQTDHYTVTQYRVSDKAVPENDRPDVATWLIVLGALFFLNIVVPALAAAVDLVIR